MLILFATSANFVQKGLFYLSLVMVIYIYCPFCGVKLPPEFDQENWWDKEFKTFKWDKDHKLGEWADDYVDDCDWSYEELALKKEEEKAELDK